MQLYTGTSLSENTCTRSTRPKPEGNTHCFSLTCHGPCRSLFLVCLILLATVAACSHVQSLDRTEVARASGFLRDGQTTEHEVKTRLGTPHAVYENGHILIYQTFFDSQDRLSLTTTPGGTCHALVLVFGDDDRLQQHSLVKNGCQGFPP